MRRDIAAGVNERLKQKFKPHLIASAFVLVLMLGFVDYVTGAELNISIFYLLPISLTAWFVNRKTGLLLSIVSAAVGLTADLIAGHNYSHPMIVYWNWAVQFGFFLIIVFIISALKAGYESTVELNANLQATVAELKRTQDELTQKAQDLARSNQELERFAYVAAHDLKEPLIVAGGFIDRLMRHCEEKLEPNAVSYIRRALEGIARMEALISALLAYAKAGTKGNDFTLTDHNDIVERATINLQAEIEKSGAIVTHDMLPTLLVDDIQMIQLFQNLLSNGIKFRKQESPRVHVSAEQGDEEWVFSVSDNGIGIDPKYATRIFDIFERLHGDSKYPGSGIGLAICKKIVENHGGRIWVESKLEKGSAFKFTIPKRKPVSFEVGNPKPSQGHRSSLRNKRP